MTPKEQELWQDLYHRCGTDVANAVISKARECYAQELQAERMVTFKLSQQIEKKDAALKECLKMIDCDDQSDLYWKPVVKQIKEALE